MNDPNQQHMKPVKLLPIALGHRPTLIELWNTCYFHPKTLAILAGVSEDVIIEMFCYAPVSWQQAMSVLNAFNALMKKSYTFLDVDIPIASETP